jgi:excisionase family DNA binding protein
MELAGAISVGEAAELLGVEERAVRLMAASGDVEAIKRGNAWWLDRRAVERRGRLQPGRGRRLSPAMAWSVLLLASGVQNDAAPIGAKHHPARARRWLDTHSLADDASRLSARAQRESFDAHPSELERIARRADVMRTGISAADLIGVHGGGREIELYAPAGSRDTIVDAHALERVDGPVLLRWVPDELWPAVHREVAPQSAILVDLLEHDDPRARREAELMLRRGDG